MSKLGEFATSQGLSHRPTRTRLNRLLINDLNKVGYKDLCADIACSYFMNTEFFNNHVYFGVDINEKSLKKGVTSTDDRYYTNFIKAPVNKPAISALKHKERDSRVAVLGDVLKNDLFPEGSLDIITSTHTFSHLPDTEHLDTIESFQKYLKQGGYLFFNLHASKLDNKIINYVQSRFEEVDFVYYGNQISQMYDFLISDDDGSVPLIETPFLRHLQFGLALGLNILEILPGNNKEMVYIRCQMKL
jgi:hypothetical protein